MCGFCKLEVRPYVVACVLCVDCGCADVCWGMKADAVSMRNCPQLGWVGGGGAEAKIVSNRANPRVGGMEMVDGGGTDVVL